MRGSDFSSPIRVQSASPVYIWLRVRPCTVSAAIPATSVTFPAPLPLSPFYPPDLDRRVDPLLSLEGVPDLPVAPQDEAGLTKTFQTWPRGWFHIP